MSNICRPRPFVLSLGTKRMMNTNLKLHEFYQLILESWTFAIYFFRSFQPEFQTSEITPKMFILFFISRERGATLKVRGLNSDWKGGGGGAWKHLFSVNLYNFQKLGGPDFYHRMFLWKVRGFLFLSVSYNVPEDGFWTKAFGCSLLKKVKISGWFLAALNPD